MFKHLQHKFISKDLVSAVKMLSYEYDYIYLMVMNSVTEKKLWAYFFKMMEFSLNRIKSRFKAGKCSCALTPCHSKTICSEEGLVLEMPAFLSFKGVQLTLLSQLIKPKFLVCLSSLSISLSDCLSTCLFIPKSACLCLFVCLYLSVCLSTAKACENNPYTCKSKLRNTEYNAALDHIPKTEYCKGSFSYIQ